MPGNPYSDAANALLATGASRKDDILSSNSILGKFGSDLPSDFFLSDNEQNALSQYQTNAMNYDVFLEDRGYVAGREDTAIARQIADMKKAGLNPAMIAQTPSGASSNAGASGAPAGNAPSRVNTQLESRKLSNKLLNTLINGAFSTLNTVIRTVGNYASSAKVAK